MLRIMIEKQKQLPDEQTFYINEAESQCRRIDKNMVWICTVLHVLRRHLLLLHDAA